MVGDEGEACPSPFATPGPPDSLSQEVIAKFILGPKFKATLKEFTAKGNQTVREFQARLEHWNASLGNAFQTCLESQLKLHEENQRLIGVMQALVAALAKLGGAFGMPAGASPYSWTPLVGAAKGCVPPESAAHSSRFSIVLRKADGASLGLKLSFSDRGDSLLVDSILPGGVVDAWNRQCVSGLVCDPKAVLQGDEIVEVNGISKDARAMAAACTKRHLLRLVIQRAGVWPESSQQPQPAAPTGWAHLPEGAAPQVPPVAWAPRVDAPAFVPSASACLQGEASFEVVRPMSSVPTSPVNVLQPRTLWRGGTPEKADEEDRDSTEQEDDEEGQCVSTDDESFGEASDMWKL